MARVDEEIVRFICFVPLTGAPHTLWFLVISNIFLAITTTLGNTLILAALHKESSLRPPSKILLRSLALTDLCVGILLEPLFVIFLLIKEYENCNLCFQYFNITVVIDVLFSFLSLFTLTAISVDRLLALSLGMRYRQVVTFKRVLVAVICFWTLNVCCATAAFWKITFISYYCFASILLCVTVSIGCYIEIYLKLLHHQAQIQEHVHQGQPSGHEPLNIARYRKTVSSALWVQLTLVTCYLPVGIVTGLLMFGWEMTPSLMLAWMLSLTLVFINSTLNPILYCWKIQEVRRAVIGTVRQITCC
ncbi:adenosine receptor A3-like [Oculina patagonica]